MGGSDRQVALHTKEGIRLGLICEMQSWVWVCKTKPGTQFVVTKLLTKFKTRFPYTYST